MKDNENLSLKENTPKRTLPEDICYSSEDIVKGLKYWEHKAGFSKEITPKPGPYLDFPTKPWEHFMNEPIRR